LSEKKDPSRVPAAHRLVCSYPPPRRHRPPHPSTRHRELYSGSPWPPPPSSFTRLDWTAAPPTISSFFGKAFSYVLGGLFQESFASLPSPVRPPPRAHPLRRRRPEASREEHGRKSSGSPLNLGVRDEISRKLGIRE
jgi:hypothetical protein